jgi:hypothetical protein
VSRLTAIDTLEACGGLATPAHETPLDCQCVRTIYIIAQVVSNVNIW